MEYLPSYQDSLHADIQPSYQDSLTHHGIKGQKWGVRRFQNADGSLTPAGEKRYLKKLNRASKDEEVSYYFATKHLDNAKYLKSQQEIDPVAYKKQFPKELLNQEMSRARKWAKTNKKAIARVEKYMAMMKLKDKRLVYNPVTFEYSIEEVNS